MGIRGKIKGFFKGLSPKKNYPVYANCSTCGKNTYLPFTCPYCGGCYCGTHHLPFNHDCKNIGAWKNQSSPSSGKK